MGKLVYLNKEQLEHLYWEEKLNQSQIANRLGYCIPTIISYFKKFGIPTRTTIEANRLSWASGTRKITPMRGEKNHFWRGGRSIQRGYILLKRPDHPRANPNGYVSEHLLVWEEAHGCPLPEGQEIHHLNSKPADNRPENLVAVTSKGHPKLVLLKAARKRIRELEEEIRILKAQQKFNLEV